MQVSCDIYLFGIWLVIASVGYSHISIYVFACPVIMQSTCQIDMYTTNNLFFGSTTLVYNCKKKYGMVFARRKNPQ